MNNLILGVLLVSPFLTAPAEGCGSKIANSMQVTKTLNHYSLEASDYENRTRDLDLSIPQRDFLENLPPKNRSGKQKILSVGCGPAQRDEPIFLSAGFDVLAYDGAAGMVALARKNLQPLGGRAVEATFGSFCSRERFDGIWALASLHHSPKADLPPILRRHFSYLKKGGAFYLSFLKGTGEKFTEIGAPYEINRIWTRFTEASLRQFLKTNLPESSLRFVRETTTNNQGFLITWVEAMLIKPY